MGVILPIAGPILEGPRGQNPYHQATDLVGSETRRRRRRRGLPFRPYLHARISRITVVEQLPQTMTIMRFCEQYVTFLENSIELPSLFHKI